MPSVFTSSKSAAPSKYRIAFTFAGQKRAYVEEVAEILEILFGQNKVLYDNFHEAEFSHPELARDLPHRYREADLIVAVFSRDYQTKDWCGLEWRVLFALIKERQGNKIMLSRFDQVDVPDLEGLGGFMELDRKTPEEAAMLILERLALNELHDRNFYKEQLKNNSTYRLKKQFEQQSCLLKQDFEKELAAVQSRFKECPITLPGIKIPSNWGSVIICGFGLVAVVVALILADSTIGKLISGGAYHLDKDGIAHLTKGTEVETIFHVMTPHPDTVNDLLNQNERLSPEELEYYSVTDDTLKKWEDDLRKQGAQGMTKWVCKGSSSKPMKSQWFYSITWNSKSDVKVEQIVTLYAKHFHRTSGIYIEEFHVDAKQHKAAWPN